MTCVQEAFARLLAQQREWRLVAAPVRGSPASPRTSASTRSAAGGAGPTPARGSPRRSRRPMRSRSIWWRARARDPETRYDLAESATYAFLLALEALSPRQRAVLLLRDVVGSSARETAELLDISEGNVRVLHLRARRALEEYDRDRCVPTAELRERHRAGARALPRMPGGSGRARARGAPRRIGADGDGRSGRIHRARDAAGGPRARRAPLPDGRTAPARRAARATRSGS